MRTVRPPSFFLRPLSDVPMTRPARELVRGHTVPPRDTRGRREGFSTGTAAAAAAKAACLVLLDQDWPESVPIQLPIPRVLEIPINRLAFIGDEAQAGVIKDAGDDPDVTHGAEVLATVRWVAEPGVHLRGGPGVGIVTRPGLELPVGSPAINPVPRRMIQQAVLELLSPEWRLRMAEPDYTTAPQRYAAAVAEVAARLAPGVEVTVSVADGEALARRTFNGRLGIVGGLSILGTTGVVRALSTAAWRASVLQAIDVAAANGVAHLVLSTGGRTERFAQARYPHLPELAFVEMGIFTGDCVRRAAERGVGQVSLCCMVGKLSKLAAGRLQTHVAGNQVDCGFLAELAREAGAAEELAAAVGAANTARHVQELIEAADFGAFFTLLCQRAGERVRTAAPGGPTIEVVLFDFDGRVLASYNGPV